MKKLSDRSLKIRELIKEQAIQKKITYAKLAKDTDVSLPTMKRWLSKDDIPLEAMDRILQALDLSWSDLIAVIEAKEIRRVSLDEKQEAYVASHPREAFVFLLIFVGYDCKSIQKELDLSDKKLEQILFDLDRNNLITYVDKNSVHPLIKPPFRWDKEGKFSKKYSHLALESIFHGIVKENADLSGRFSPSDPLVNFGEMYLSSKTATRFKADLFELLEKYREIGRQEVKFKDITELDPLTFLLAADQFPLWKKVMWETRY